MGTNVERDADVTGSKVQSKTWSAEVVAVLRAHIQAAQLTGEQIARDLNKRFGLALSRNAVLGKIDRMNTSLPRKQRLKKARKSGRKRRARLMSAGPISEFIGGHDTNGCRWIDGEVHTGRWQFCGHERVEGKSWCAYHCTRVFVLKDAA